MDLELNFEEIQVVKFRWLVWNQLLLKEASQHQAVFGIALSIITLVFCAGRYFLRHNFPTEAGFSVFSDLPSTGPALLAGTLVLIYSILLLNRADWSTLIGRGMSWLDCDWWRGSQCCWHQQSYAIKNQLGRRKPQEEALDTLACSSRVLYGKRIVGFHARKGHIIGALTP